MVNVETVAFACLRHGLQGKARKEQNVPLQRQGCTSLGSTQYGQCPGSTAPQLQLMSPNRDLVTGVSFQLSTYMHTYIHPPLRLKTYLVIFQSTSHFLPHQSPDLIIERRFVCQKFAWPRDESKTLAAAAVVPGNTLTAVIAVPWLNAKVTQEWLTGKHWGNCERQADENDAQRT